MPRSPIDGGVVLLTGASSGIGWAMAEELGPRARVLCLLARREGRLAELRDLLLSKTPRLEVVALACDLTQRGSVDEALLELERRGLAVDVLINNAGLGDVGLFETSRWEKNDALVALNVTSLAYLTHRLLPGMISRARGGILNVSSGFGLAFLPGLAMYIGTKHFVTGFTEALRSELSGTGVRVTQVCPGPIPTEFDQHAGNVVKVPGVVQISSRRCARAALRAFDWNFALAVPGVLISCLILLGRFVPRFVQRLVFVPLAKALRRMKGARAA